MRKFGLTLMTATALIAGSSQFVLATPASTPGGIHATTEELNLLTTVQYVFEGRRHCWYPDGWHGPGWYWCGYAWRRGFGWGGPVGFNGWEHRERMEERREHRDERREYRRY
jgi:hypothetical protein